MKRIVIVTDCKDVAFSEMKWSIESPYDGIGWRDLSIDLVPVEEFSIANAAFLTRLTGELCGEETLIWVVINPQKHRSDRIFGRTQKGLQFFGANTGALTWLLRDQGVEELYRIDDPGFVTFGGKFVHSPNVSKIISGEPMSTLGSKFSEESLTDFVPETGQVVLIDNFGLLKICGEKVDFTDGDVFKIYLNSRYVFDAKFSSRMMSNEDDEWILFSGSSLHGMPELGCVRNKTEYQKFGIRIGDHISWTRSDY